MGYNPMMGMQQGMMGKGGPMMGGPQMMGGMPGQMGGPRPMMPNPQMQQMQMMQMMQQKGAQPMMGMPGGKGMPGQMPQGGPRPAAPAPQPQAAPQQGGPLNAAALAAAPPAVQKQMIGEKLYPAIAKFRPAEAGKITGMMLEMDNSELLMLLESEAQLKSKVDEAMGVLGGQR